jgi:creatinine deaminase
MTDAFMQAAIDEARQGHDEGGIPIGSVLVHRGEIIGRSPNRRIQKGSPILTGVSKNVSPASPRSRFC